jgi:HEAT repeat protein
MAPSHTLATLPIARTSINIGSNAHDTRPTLGIIDSNAHPSATSINKRRFDEVVELVRDRRHGKVRDMMVLRLANLDGDRAVDVLIELLGDGEVAGFAVMALGKLKAKHARSRIKPLLKHPQPWVRKEASKALAALDK